MLRSLDDTTAHLTARHTRQQLREINHELSLAMGYQRKIRILPACHFGLELYLELRLVFLVLFHFSIYYIRYNYKRPVLGTPARSPSTLQR